MSNCELVAMLTFLEPFALCEQYMPTIGDMYTKDVEVNGAPRHVEIDDTAGQEAYADLKKEKMSTGDVSLRKDRACRLRDILSNALPPILDVPAGVSARL